jgi:hypothetical protein
MADKKNNSTNLSLWLSVEDMTLVYELLHDVKVTYVKLTEEDKRKASAKSVIASCNRIMKKIEYKLLGATKEKKEESK